MAQKKIIFSPPTFDVLYMINYGVTLEGNPTIWER